MRPRSRSAWAVAFLAGAAACTSSGPTSTDGTWVGTITTEGNVTTVVNESGSVWGGSARLVEEASIGVEAGAPEYMLGEVRGVVASDDRIYVLDGQVPAVRVYDFNGRHLMDMGGPGDGPGEFRFPDHLAIGPDGAIYVRGGMSGRLTIFEPDGTLRDTWPMDGGRMTSRPTVITPDGTVFMPDYVTSGDERRTAMISWGPDGAGDLVLEEPALAIGDYQLVARGAGPTLALNVPFAPRRHWVLAPSGAIVTAASDDYSFEIQQRGGERIVIRKTWAPVAVDPGEAAWRSEDIFDTFRSYYPDWTWDGPEVPPTKPAFDGLMPGRSGRVWVRRSGPGRYNPACDDPEPPRGTRCWIADELVDVFGDDGRYLGEVELPEGFALGRAPFLQGDLVVGVVEDEAGTIMVKRYRLVLPGDE